MASCCSKILFYKFIVTVCKKKRYNVAFIVCFGIIFLTVVFQYSENIHSPAMLLSHLSAKTSNNFINKSGFNINGTDVIIFLHIQKTGGSHFRKHLLNDLILTKHCIKYDSKPKTPVFCPRPFNDTPWLYSNYIKGSGCSSHASWTSLIESVPSNLQPIQDGRKFFYITLIREPVARYLSEWRHVYRGATWKKSCLLCNGKLYRYSLCFKGDNWKGVTLEEFMSCSHNFAANRQTHMLANLREINCTGLSMNQSEEERILLESAKRNLQKMTFFGITDRQRESQILLEYVLDLKFSRVFYNRLKKTFQLTPDQIHRIRELNHLDVELFEFASKLFDLRYKSIVGK